jgi:hypothetical protein
MKGKRKGKSDILVSETETINSELEKQDKQEKKELIETLITHIETLPLQNYTIDKS